MDLLNKTFFLFFFFPFVSFSKAQMDLLVALCAQYHLNPSSHTLELVTANKSIKFKPNALIGTFNAEKVILKSKEEDKNKKKGPQMPEVCCEILKMQLLLMMSGERGQRCSLCFLLVVPGNCSDGDKL